jgi:hypothetical protein
MVRNTDKYGGNTSGNMAHREVPNNLGWIMGTNCHPWSFRPIFHPVDKANAIAGCLEHRFTPHALCEENHKRRVEARVQALLEAEDNDPLNE